jgi:hypothetical protein
MLEVVAARGARMFTSARALELTMDRGRVTGVVVDVAGERRTFRGTAGVVLAAGGFEWNEDLWRGLVRVPGVVRMSPPDNRGDGLRMAQRAGARLALLDQVWWSITAGGQPGQLVVNRSGRRFMNECIAYNDYGKILGYFDPHTYQFPNIPAYVISSRPLEPADASAPTLRELGEAIGVDAASLEATVAEFDKHAELGEDPAFGRGVAGWDRWRKLDKTLANPALAPLGSAGPFYAQLVVARCFGTKGGPVINSDAQIVAMDGTPIPGLFGAGNAVASIFGAAYPGGGATLGPAAGRARAHPDAVRPADPGAVRRGRTGRGGRHAVPGQPRQPVRVGVLRPPRRRARHGARLTALMGAAAWAPTTSGTL